VHHHSTRRLVALDLRSQKFVRNTQCPHRLLCIPAADRDSLIGDRFEAIGLGQQVFGALLAPAEVIELGRISVNVQSVFDHNQPGGDRRLFWAMNRYVDYKQVAAQFRKRLRRTFRCNTVTNCKRQS
jgi:hypothetical protein